MTLSVRTFKAQPVGNAEVPNLEITATESIDSRPAVECGTWPEQLDREAIAIVDAMVASLPGGIVSRVHAILTQRYANQLAVAWDSMKQAAQPAGEPS